MAVTYFGLNTNGNNHELRSANYLQGMLFQNTAGAGTLTELGINYYAGVTSHVRLGIYADSAGSPGALLLDAGEITNPVTGWNTISGLSLAVTNGTYYWLAFNQDYASGADIYVDTTITNRDYISSAYGALPNPFGTPGGTGQSDICMRAGVTAGGATQTLYPDAISSLEGFGGDKVNFILPSIGGIASLETFGLSKFVLYLLPSGIISLEGFGTDKINFTLLPSGILTAEGFGDGKLNFRLFPAGVESAEIFGSHTVTLLSGVQYLSPSSIASVEAFGSSKLNLRLYAQAIVSSEAFGIGTIRLYLQPSSIESLEAFGSAKINFKLLIEAIQSAEAFGDSAVQWDQFLEPAGIATGESFGMLVVSFPGVVPVVIGVRSAAAGLSNRAPAGLKRTAGAGLRRDA